MFSIYDSYWYNHKLLGNICMSAVSKHHIMYYTSTVPKFKCSHIAYGLSVSLIVLYHVVGSRAS